MDFLNINDLLERFFDVSLDLLCIADTDGNFLKVNRAWEGVLGYPVEELEASRFLDFVHPDDIDATLKAMSTLEDQEDVLNFVNRYRRKDGRYRFIEWCSNPSGKLIFAAARDITERVMTEEKLKKSEEKYRLLAENTEAILWEYDVPADNWTYVAPQAERILGYSPEEWTGIQFWADHIHEDDRSWATQYCAECIERGEAHTFEYRFLAKDGRIVWLRDVVSVEMQNGKPVRLRGFIVDITKRKSSSRKCTTA